MDTRNFENVMRSTKSLQTGPGCVVLVFFSVLPTYVTNFKVNMERSNCRVRRNPGPSKAIPCFSRLPKTKLSSQD